MSNADGSPLTWTVEDDMAHDETKKPLAKLKAAEEREKKLVAALEEIKAKEGYCIFGSSETDPDPEVAFRQGSAYSNSDCAAIAAEALKEMGY